MKKVRKFCWTNKDIVGTMSPAEKLHTPHLCLHVVQTFHNPSEQKHSAALFQCSPSVTFTVFTDPPPPTAHTSICENISKLHLLNSRKQSVMRSKRVVKLTPHLWAKREPYPFAWTCPDRQEIFVGKERKKDTGTEKETGLFFSLKTVQVVFW